MKRITKITVLMITLMIMVFTSACGKSVRIDYADAESFEAALNAGENLEGKVVQFVAGELHPQSAFGYNIWAGEHLNFISSRNPGFKQGDIVVVKATTIESNLGSWLIRYEVVNNGKIMEDTISNDGVEVNGATANSSRGDGSKSESIEVNKSDELEQTDSDSSTAVFSVGNSSQKETAKALEITDYGWFFNEISSYDDTVYVEFCTMIHNPNETLVAEFPKALVTVKNGDGSILATEEQTGSVIMPGDTITLCGMFSMPVSDVTDDAQIAFNVDWSDFSNTSSFYKSAKTSDFAFSNVSERNSDQNYITGEITNNFSEDVDTVNLSIVLRKGGEIVYMENTFLDGLKAGQTKAFEFQRYHDWPEHDEIECSAMVW